VGVSVAGTLRFDDCDGLTGAGSVSGKKWCEHDAVDGDMLYAMVAESKVGPSRNGQTACCIRLAFHSKNHGQQQC
jgi:hypothetical protein